MRRIALLWFATVAAQGCGRDEGGGLLGVVAGAAADVVATVALAWYPESSDVAVLEVAGQVTAEQGTFDVGALLALELSPPVRTCDDGPPSADAPGLGVAWIVGVHGAPTEVDPLAPAETADARCDDLVVAYATHEVRPEAAAWSSFEAALPAGLSLMRRRWCDTWTGETCARIGEDPFCLEPVAQDAVVVLRAF